MASAARGPVKTKMLEILGELALAFGFWNISIPNIRLRNFAKYNTMAPQGSGEITRLNNKKADNCNSRKFLVSWHLLLVFGTFRFRTFDCAILQNITQWLLR